MGQAFMILWERQITPYGVAKMSGEIGWKDWFLKLLHICIILIVKKELKLFVTDVSPLPWGKTISGLSCKMPLSCFYNCFELLLTTSV